ncbi:MAG: hypothetical protein ACKPCG_12825 [Dolichospermum sp.]
MSQTGLNLFIPMELLINSLNALSLSEKQQHWPILDNAIAKDEEIKKEIQLVNDEYTNKW